jgi:hypothetical protein
MHVGISQELLNKVSHRIRFELKPKDYRLHFGVDDVDNTFKLPSDHPIVSKAIWGKYEHLQAQMPSSWLEKLDFDYSDEADLRLRTKTRDPQLNARGVKFVDICVGLKKKREITVPPKCARYTTFDVDQDICPEIKEFFDKKIEDTKFELKWQKIADDVRAFLDSNKSLNAALKAWPELRAFIPADYIARVEKKCERKASREEAERKLAEIDREGAVAAATLAALAA